MNVSGRTTGSPARVGAGPSGRGTAPGVSRLALFAGLMAAMCAGPAAGQEARVLATVDYVAGDNLYLSAGSDHGLVVGDTVALFLEPSGPPSGQVVVESLTPRRSVVSWLGPARAWERGVVVYLGVTGPGPDESAGAAAVSAASGEPDLVGDPAGPGARTASPSQAEPGGMRTTGRIGVDFDLMRSVTHWSGGDDVERTFATPVVRVSALVTRMPGDLRFRINARGSYRHSSGTTFSSPESIRVYSVSLEKRFDRIPLEVQLGRFGNRFESYSGYWDGLLMRVGGRSLGVGAVAGYDPRYSNERISTELPKLTGWVDFGVARAGWGYATDLSIHHMAPRNGLSDRTWLGWSQDVRLGPVALYQRLQLDRSRGDDSWAVSRAQVSLSASLGRNLTLRGNYSAQEPYSIWREGDDPFLPRRDRATAGLTLAGALGSLYVNLGGHRGAGEDWEPAATGGFGISPRVLGGWGLNGSGSYWARGDGRAWVASPGITRDVGPARIRARYQFYRTSTARLTMSTHGADIGMEGPIAGRMRGSVRFLGQTGTFTRSGRIRLSLWVPF